MIFSCLVACLASCLVGWLIVSTAGIHGRHTSDTAFGSPQKVNPVAAPRIGGLAILSGLVAGGYASTLKFDESYWWGVLILASIPAFIGGMIEDITKRFSVSSRLLTTFIAAGIGFFLLDARITEVQIPGVDFLLGITLVSFAFTLFAIGGFAHAMNIIDGFNGLSGGVSILMLASLAAVSVQVGDTLVLHASLVLGGAIFGFMLLNYPSGLIFAGDAGAYLMGFLIAELAAILVHRNSEVSPWFPLVLLLYPVWETLFSAYRRRFVRGESPGAPDALHMHTLIYRRLIRWIGGERTTRALTMRNARTSPYLWFITGFVVLPGTIFWDHTAILQGIVVTFVILYVWLYRRIVRFHAPKILLLTLKNPNKVRRLGENGA